MRALGRFLLTLVLLGGLGLLGWKVWQRLQAQEQAPAKERGPEAAPVEVAPIETGAIELERTFTGTLEASAEVVVASKVGGRVVRLELDLADSVKRGEVVCWIDDAEYQQAINQADAELTVANAHLIEATKSLEIATRGLARIEQLQKTGVASDVRYDEAVAEQLSKEAAVAVAGAQVTRATAALEAARIRADYTKVTATWTGKEEERIVAERYVDEGDTVGANAPLLRIVGLDPLIGVILVAERDYGRLSEQQAVKLTTDAWSGEQFDATVARISPVFGADTRQARIELSVPNPGSKLKPGMFIRATVVLQRIEGATIVPQEALSDRADQTGVFVLDADGTKVHWRPVTVGLRAGRRVQVSGDRLVGRVVVLGHQLVDDGSAVLIPGAAGEPADGTQEPR